MIHIVERNAALAQAVRDGVAWESGVVLLAREPLFLRRRDRLAVLNEGRCAVVIKRGDA